MNQKILWQLCDEFRGSPLRGADSLILSLQLLAWARISGRGEINPPGLQLEQAIAQGVEGLIEGLRQLERASGQMSQAFSGASIHAAAAPSGLQSAAAQCAKLEADGMLDSFMPEDATLDAAHARHDWSTIEPSLADLMVRLTDAKDCESVYCAWDIKAQLAARLASSGRDVWVENPTVTPFPALASIFADGHLEAVFSDPVRSPSFVAAGQLKRFDCAIGFPPVGQKAEPSIADKDLYGRFNIPKATWAVLTIQHLLAQAKRRAVIAVPHSVLHGIGSDRLLREQVVQTGKLASVVSLPAGLLAGTSVQLALLVLTPDGSSDQIRFVNATGEEFKDATGRSKMSLAQLDEIVAQVTGYEQSSVARTVDREEVRSNDMQLLVERYVLDPKQQNLKSRLAGLHKQTLGGLVETVRPLSGSPQQADGTIAVLEVGTADIPATGYVRPGRTMYVEAAMLDRSTNQFLKPGDIVLTIRGSTGKVGIVPAGVPEPGAGGWIAGASATVLRAGVSTPIEPKALVVLLRSPMGQDLLKTITSGATIPMITLRDLLRLEIPMPTPENAKAAAALLDKEQVLQEQIEALQREQSDLAGDDWALGMLGDTSTKTSQLQQNVLPTQPSK